MQEHIVIFGFGSQGKAHSLNLRDAGVHVTVALRAKSMGCAEVQRAEIPLLTNLPEAATHADIAVILIPDREQPLFWKEVIEPHLPQQATVIFAHGFSIHYQEIVPRRDLNIVLVAPFAPGDVVRQNFVEKKTTSCLLAVHHDVTGNAMTIAKKYAQAICGNGSFLESTFRAEVETDLFAEQVVLCGGIPTLVRQAYETLVDAGYDPAIASECCIKELAWLGNVLATEGLEGLSKKISDTARFGAKTRGPRIITEKTREEMRRILDEITSGVFHREQRTFP